MWYKRFKKNSGNKDGNRTCAFPSSKCSQYLPAIYSSMRLFVHCTSPLLVRPVIPDSVIDLSFYATKEKITHSPGNLPSILQKSHFFLSLPTLCRIQHYFTSSALYFNHSPSHYSRPVLLHFLISTLRAPELCAWTPFLLIFINDLADELTCNHLFFADDVKLIFPRSQQIA